MSPTFVPLRIAALTVSDTRTSETDKSGRLLTERLESAGHVLHDKAICPDDVHELRARVVRWIGLLSLEWQGVSWRLSGYLARSLIQVVQTRREPE